MTIAQPDETDSRNLYGLGERVIWLIGFHPNPIRLTDAQVEKLLTVHLRIPLGSRSKSLGVEIKKLAENFLHKVALQSTPSPSESRKQLKRVQSAAKRLQKALGWDGKSFETIHSIRVYPWLRQAAGAYGRRVKRPPELDPYEHPITDWETRRFQSCIVAVRLLELWARDAHAMLTDEAPEELERAFLAKGSKHRGFIPIHALRMTIRQLKVFWEGVTGRPAGLGVRWDKGYIPDGPYIRFVEAFFEAMRDRAGEQMEAYPGLRKLLSPKRDSIRLYSNLRKVAKMMMKQAQERAQKAAAKTEGGV